MRILFRALFVGAAFSGSALAQDRICPSCTPSNLGDLVHRDSSWDAAFVGHAGFKTLQINHVIPGQPAGQALGMVSLSNFIDAKPFWGGKMLLGVPRNDTSTADQWTAWTGRVFDKLEYLSRVGVDYDATHLSQKGGQGSRGRMVFDCVGFTEHMWEYFGYNPTDDSFEIGSGWPLTPREQRDSPRLVNSRPS
jgi:hypothetical protein